MTDTQNTRGQERLRRVGLTGIATLASKGLNIAVGLASVPLTARYLGAERFGIWLLLGSFLTWVNLVDLGLSNTLTTELARADGQDDRKSPPALVSSAFFPVLAIAACTLALFTLLRPWVPWARVLNTTGPLAVSEVGPAVEVTVLVFAMRLPLGVAGRIYSAYQEGYRFQLWSGLGSILSILGLLAALATHASLPLLLAAFYGLSLTGDAIAFLELFLLRRPWLAPRLRHFDVRAARSLLRTGLLFWVAQIAAVLLLETDLLVVARMFGVAAVAEYGVALRLFGLVSLIQMAFTGSLWPAYAEALARCEFDWVRRAFLRSVLLGAGWAIGASGALVLLGAWVIRLLLGARHPPEAALLAAMGSTAVITAVGQSFAMLLNGMGEIRIQAWLGLLSGLLNLLISVLLARVVGLPGVALGTTVAILASMAVSGSFLRNRLRSLSIRRSAAV